MIKCVNKIFCFLFGHEWMVDSSIKDEFPYDPWGKLFACLNKRILCSRCGKDISDVGEE